MNPHQRFDELVRRKLAERSFPFEPAHWTAMQHTLRAAGRHRRNRLALWLSAAAVLVLMPLAWWLAYSPAPGTPGAPMATAQAGPAARGDGPPQEAPAERTTEATPAPAERSVPGTLASTQRAPRTDASHVRPARTSPSPASIGPLLQARAVPAPSHRTEAPGKDADRAAIPYVGTAASPGTAQRTDEGDQGDGGVAGLRMEQPAAAMAQEAPLAADALAGAANAQGQAPITHPAEADHAVHALEATMHEGPAQVRAQSLAETPGGVTEQPQAVPAVPDAKPQPWDIGLLGGAMRARTRYEGTGSRDWEARVGSAWAPAYGIEAVRMGRNLGVGLGLHVGTYAERITAGALDRTAWNTSTYWHLTTVDTTILLITDTVVVDGQTYYTGQSVNVSVPVLTQGVDSTETIVRLREARRTTNRVSYLEVPLLLDAHLVRGRWHLGLRGGPTLGLLSGRHGSLPGPGGEGYTELDEQAFREVLFGWTARAYVRYRFNAGWSLGVEPMLRGLFGDGLEGDALSRRSSAAGVMLSVSCRMG